MIKIPDPKDYIYLDFETFYDKKGKYSLRTQKFSTTQYLRDPRFKVQSMALRYGKMRKARFFTDPDEIERQLRAIDWSKSALVAHNAIIEGGILSYHYGIVPAFYICTMSMARPVVGHDVGASLDEVSKYYGFAGKVKSGALDDVDGVRDPTPEQLKQLGLYNADDVDDMFGIFKHLRKHIPDSEMVLIHHTIKAYADPVLEVDRPLATAEWEKEKAERRKIILKINPIIRHLYDCLKEEDRLDDLPITRNKPSKKNPLGTPKKGEMELWEATKDREVRYERLLKILGSSNKLATMLQLIGYPPPMKWSEDQEKYIPAFALSDIEFQALANHPNRDVRLIHAARVAAKSDMAEQRAWRLLEHSRLAPLPILLNYGKAHTIRWTGGDLMNPQNFPRGSNLRRCLRAPRGYRINVVDSGQIEPRTNAMLAGQTDLLEQFRMYDKTGDKAYDPYRILAGKIYDLPPEDVSSDQRFLGKVGVLGLGYQMGAPRYQNQLELGLLGPPVIIDMATAIRVVTTYRDQNEKIVNFWYWLQNTAIPVLAGMHPNLNEAGWDFNDGRGQLWFEKGILHLPNGMCLFYRGIERHKGDYGWEYTYRVSRHEWSKLYGGLLCENIVQCLSRFMVGDQVLDIGDRYRILTLTHDECVFLSKTREAAKAQRFAEHAFSVSRDWYEGVPLRGEGGFDVCYSK